MQVTINNYRGLSHAALDLSKICLLAAPNEGGKTSASQALAAALTGEPIPIAGVKKAQAGMLVRSGTANGSVDLTSADGSTNVAWPSAKVKTEGVAPFSSHFAAGIQSIVNLDDKERVKVLTDYLKAVPTREDLVKQLANMGYSDKKLDNIWKEIEQRGWDGLQKYYEGERAGYKKLWMDVTGEQYGSKKAESWIPEGYDSDLMTQSEDKLKALVTDANDALEAAIAGDAVDNSERDKLEALASLKDERQAAVTAAKALTVDPALQAQIDEANGFIKEMSTKRDEIQKVLNELPSPKQATGMPCPHCNTVLQVSGGALTLAAVLKPAEIEMRESNITGQQNKLNSVNEAISKHMTAVSGIQSKVREQEQANGQVIADALRLLGESIAAEKELAKPVPGKSELTVDDCRRTRSVAESRLSAFQRKTKADFNHKCVESLERLIPLIAPEGIRGDVLSRALKDFNQSLERFCTAAGWKTVTLENDFFPTYGGTIYLLLSESAKFRVRVILQIGMALLDKSQALIIDAADILDKGGRNGLFKTVKASGLPALIAMTMNSKEDVPKLGAVGSSYWINSDAKAELI